MARTKRFHLDENCSKAIALGLRRYGIEVTTTPEARVLGAPDEEHAAFAVFENRVTFTRDLDCRCYSRAKHAGGFVRKFDASRLKPRERQPNVS